MKQLTMSGTLLLPGAYWVVIKNHKIIPVGARFLVVEDDGNGRLLCWRDGVKPPNGILGSLLHVSQLHINQMQLAI